MLWDYNTPIHKIFLWITLMPSIAISFIILLMTTYYVVNVRKNLKKHKYLRMIAVIGLLFYLISVASYFYGELNLHSVYYKGIPYEITLIAVCLANTSIFILFTHRLHISLNESVYRSPIYVFLFIYMLLILYIVSPLIIIITQILNVNNYHILFDILLNINFSIYIILSIFILLLFIKKLMLLTVRITEDSNIKSMPATPTMNPKHEINKTPANWHLSNFSMTTGSMHSDSVKLMRGMHNTKTTFQTIRGINDTKTTFQQTNWLNIVLKQSILLMWTMLFTDCWLLYEIIIYEMRRNCSDSCKDLLHLISAILLSLDTIINCIVIFLSFEFAEKYYIKCCCCDKCC
eukprot:547900_1